MEKCFIDAVKDSSWLDVKPKSTILGVLKIMNTSSLTKRLKKFY